jgi:[ribosomal protein S18]-alanine N-acetyltransferase
VKSMREIEILPARRADIATIAELSVEAFGEYARDPHSHAHQLCANPGARTLLARIAGRLVAFAVVSRFGPNASLDAIAVVPKERGTGLGKVILEAAESVARRDGARFLSLVTADSNLAALDLFLRSGYRVMSRHSRFYPRGQDAVKMVKPLTS